MGGPPRAVLNRWVCFWTLARSDKLCYIKPMPLVVDMNTGQLEVWDEESIRNRGLAWAHIKPLRGFDAPRGQELVPLLPAIIASLADLALARERNH